MIDNNATSIWERWDGWSKEKGFKQDRMNSFNHYSLGSMGRYMYQYMGGIDTDNDEVGFKKIIIKPHFGSGVNKFSTSFKSVRGLIQTNWERENNSIKFKVSYNHFWFRTCNWV